LCCQGMKVIIRSIVVLGVALSVLCGLWNGTAVNQTLADEPVASRRLNAKNMHRLPIARVTPSLGNTRVLMRC